MDLTQLLLYLTLAGLFAVLLALLVRFMTRSNELLDRIARQFAQAQQNDGISPKLALQLEAYERLALLMERIAIQNLILRQPADELGPAAYTAKLLLTIREEYEHNVTQQVYVSDRLWEIIILARDNVSQLITRAAEGAESGQQIANRLLVMGAKQPNDPIALAQSAIRREAATIR